MRRRREPFPPFSPSYMHCVEYDGLSSIDHRCTHTHSFHWILSNQKIIYFSTNSMVPIFYNLFIDRSHPIISFNMIQFWNTYQTGQFLTISMHSSRIFSHTSIVNWIVSLVWFLVSYKQKIFAITNAMKNGKK